MKLTMDLGQRSYDIIIKNGALEKAGLLANLGGKVMVVTDEGVPEQHVKCILNQCGSGKVFVLPKGEQGKSVQQWQAILSKMLENGFARTDAVAAVGGGMAGDVAGFAAAAYMRGINFYQFPTTTLSQLDSSIGGKTALNLDGVKNIIGAFHQPSLVVADPKTLDTLPRRHWSNGLAEALKTALIGSTELFEILEKEDIEKNIERILYLGLRYKKSVVERDETEQGERKLLNFGHTIGHAIEAAGGLENGEEGFLHGEAVALGMLPMLESRTLVRRTRAVMRKLELPLKHPYSPEELMGYIQQDKKRSDDKITVARVKTLGQGYLETIDMEELELIVKGES